MARDAAPPDMPPEVVRRAPFADNPQVGARGQRTQQRILDAALEVFGESGYHQCSIDSIATRARCSRAAFYQYFSSKEDVFRHLAGQVARQLDASHEALEPLAASEAGWRSIRAWVSRHSEIYDRTSPCSTPFQAASESDDAVASGSARWGVRDGLADPLADRDACDPSRQLDPLILQLLECVTRTHDVAKILRSAAPGHYADDRVCDALADVIAPSLFGLRPEDSRPPSGLAPAAGASLRSDHPRRLRAARRRAGSDVGRSPDAGSVARRRPEGVRRARLPPHVRRRRDGGGGRSRAAFYRYFANKDELARTRDDARDADRLARPRRLPGLGDDRGRGRSDGAPPVAAPLQPHPEPARPQCCACGSTRRSRTRHSTPAPRRPSTGAGARSRRSSSRRRFGDVDTECVVLIAHLSAFGARKRSAAEIGAAAHVIEQGLLGLRPRRP